MKENGSDVKYVYRHLPLSIHEHAIIAAEAAEAAGEQGKFWEMEERVLANLSQLSPAFLRQTASDLGLDMARFDAALMEHKHLARIQADAEEARRKGISSTPTFVINGKAYSGAPSFAELHAAVTEARSRAR